MGIPVEFLDKPSSYSTGILIKFYLSINQLQYVRNQMGCCSPSYQLDYLEDTLSVISVNDAKHSFRKYKTSRNYLDSIPCFNSPLMLLNTSAIPIPIFFAIIAAVFNEFSLRMPLL